MRLEVATSRSIQLVCLSFHIYHFTETNPLQIFLTVVFPPSYPPKVSQGGLSKTPPKLSLPLCLIPFLGLGISIRPIIVTINNIYSKPNMCQALFQLLRIKD